MLTSISKEVRLTVAGELIIRRCICGEQITDFPGKPTANFNWHMKHKHPILNKILR